MQPFILERTFPLVMRQQLLSDIDLIIANKSYVNDSGFGRIVSEDGSLTKYSEYLAPLVRRVFSNQDIQPSYALWARYAGFEANLPRHKDDNACTFTVDYCVRQKAPWGIFVEGEQYVLQENESLVFMGEDQEHWRGPFPRANMVEMIFFHYVAADHWFFDDTKERPERFRT